MARKSSARTKAPATRAADRACEEYPDQVESLRAALDAGIETAKRKLSEMDSEPLSNKKEAAALLEKLLKLRKEFAMEEAPPTEIQLIWNADEDQ